jgi:hypothetical protein
MSVLRFQSSAYAGWNPSYIQIVLCASWLGLPQNLQAVRDKYGAQVMWWSGRKALGENLRHCLFLYLESCVELNQAGPLQ